MVNKIIEKLLVKFIAKKFGIGNQIMIKSIEVNAVNDQRTKVSLSIDITVKNEDVLNWIDKSVN